MFVLFQSEGESLSKNPQHSQLSVFMMDYHVETTFRNGKKMERKDNSEKASASVKEDLTCQLKWIVENICLIVAQYPALQPRLLHT